MNDAIEASILIGVSSLAVLFQWYDLTWSRAERKATSEREASERKLRDELRSEMRSIEERLTSRLRGLENNYRGVLQTVSRIESRLASIPKQP